MAEVAREVDFEIPEKLEFLFAPHRYKVGKGGRGSAKSWSFATALLIQGLTEPLRIGCFRETQKSIKDSVHKLLSDTIKRLRLGWFYKVTKESIRSRFSSIPTEFLFAGLSDQTADSIKSFEGLDRAWVEEADKVTARSWSILRPTIRKPGSEIWISFNPQLESDPTYQMFVADPPPDCVVVDMNWRDNPWWNDTLEAERQDTLKKDPKGYPNIWEGICRPAVEGAIYYDEIAAAELGNRITLVPHDPLLRTHLVLDLGFGDAMAVGLVQRHASSIRFIAYREFTRTTYAEITRQLRQEFPACRWGTAFLPHDGRAGNAFTGKSAEETMRDLGWNVAIVPNIGLDNGIRACRQSFPMMFFDKAECARLVECLKRYRRDISQKTQHAGQPVHDEYSHGADMTRYAAISAPQMTNETDDWGASLDYPEMNLA